MIRVLVLLLVSGAASAQSQLLSPNEECETALHRLVDSLEEREKLGYETRITGLPGDKSRYTNCRISPTLLKSPSISSYFIYRHADNVTVYVYKSVGNTATFVLYGPFRSEGQRK